MNIAKILEPISGDKLYQERARAALPLLVRQAEAGTPIFYSDLAEELEMPNPRNLDYVLGGIGQTIERLSKAWKEKVPPIQCLVVNKKNGLPGEGIGWFIVKKEEYSKLSLRQRRAIVDAELQHIYTYRRWREVLSTLSLAPVNYSFEPVLKKASTGIGGGESEQHRALKEYVARNPSVIGLASGMPAGTTEFPLPSGDSLDVSFEGKGMWVAAEVKSGRSNDADIARGIFQCVKYRTVMEAVLLVQSRSHSARAILVLESSLPKSLIPLRNLLAIEVIEGVAPTS